MRNFKNKTYQDSIDWKVPTNWLRHNCHLSDSCVCLSRLKLKTVLCLLSVQSREELCCLLIKKPVMVNDIVALFFDKKLFKLSNYFLSSYYNDLKEVLFKNSGSNFMSRLFFRWLFSIIFLTLNFLMPASAADSSGTDSMGNDLAKDILPLFK